MLKCPNCGGKLSLVDKTYKCENGHSFDIAKSGYTNLLVHTQKETGDSKEMVKARTDFFLKDYYHILKEKMIELIDHYQAKVVLDSGCGQGYYTGAIKKALDVELYGIDMSKHALNRASKDNKDIKYFAANVFYPPFVDESFDLVYSIFAPISFEANRRILKKDGIFIKVGPAPRHLLELKEVVYDSAYLNELKEVSGEGFIKSDEIIIEDEIKLNNSEDIMALFSMTPYLHTSPIKGKERLEKLTSLKTTIAFRIEIFKKVS